MAQNWGEGGSKLGRRGLKIGGRGLIIGSKSIAVFLRLGPPNRKN